jgi:Family of unknown function (DUF6492)
MRVASEYTLVTVAHRDDYGLMLLQARSLDKYLSRDLASEILVIENPQPGQPTNWRDRLFEEYGALAARVRFVEAREVADIPAKVSGWFSQQILKLMVSALISTDRYLVLDGKNHLVREMTRGFVEGASGLPRSYLMDYETHPMKAYLKNTLDYFGLDPDAHIHAFSPTTTPFVFSTALVRELVRHVEARERRTFPDAFLYDGYKRSEFFLFAAYILSLGRALSDVYELSGAPCPAIWPESTVTECRDAIAASDNNAMPVFALHRRAIPKLDDSARRDLAAFWIRRGLFGSLAAAVRFLSNPGAVEEATENA